jgi:hypothetical protein
MNPIAFVMIVLGIMFLGLGLLIMVRQRKGLGITVSLFGFCLAAIPPLITFFLFK